MSETTLVLRLDQQLKNDFDWACAQSDSTASHALRNFMRKFVDDVLSKKAMHMQIPPPATEGPRFVFNTNDPQEVMSVRKRLFLAQEFENLHPSVPLMEHAERELLKQAAYDKINNEKLPVAERADAAVDIIKGHFMRSAQSSINPEHPTSINWHPGFDEYAKHYIPAVDLVKSFGPEVYGELVRRYPLDGPSRMDGSISTYWPRTEPRRK